MTGTLIRKTEPHQKFWSSTPPSTGPSATPPDITALHTAIALPRSRSSWNRLRIRASVLGIRVAPPTPSSARAPISMAALVLYAATRDAAEKVAAPSRSSLRRPIRSPIEPIVRSRPARTNP